MRANKILNRISYSHTNRKHCNMNKFHDTSFNIITIVPVEIVLEMTKQIQKDTDKQIAAD